MRLINLTKNIKEYKLGIMWEADYDMDSKRFVVRHWNRNIPVVLKNITPGYYFEEHRINARTGSMEFRIFPVKLPEDERLKILWANGFRRSTRIPKRKFWELYNEILDDWYETKKVEPYMYPGDLHCHKSDKFSFFIWGERVPNLVRWYMEDTVTIEELNDFFSKVPKYGLMAMRDELLMAIRNGLLK